MQARGNRSVSFTVAGFAAAIAMSGLPGCAMEPTEEELETSDIESELKIGGVELELDLVYGRLNIESKLASSDGNKNRFKWYENLGWDDGSLVFLNGRVEYIEKYDALFTHLAEFPVGGPAPGQTLADLPLTFVTMDHAGQGESLGGDRLRGHIDDFGTFVDDVELLFSRVRKLDRHRKPVYLMAHSMGGLVAARFAQDNPDKIDGLILGSPLLGVRTPPGVTEAQLRGIAQFYAEGVGLPRLCTSPPGVTVEQLAGVALCASGGLGPQCQACFFDPACPDPMVQQLQQLFAYLQSIGDQGCPVLPAQCPAPHQTTDDAYCEYAENHPLRGPQATFGWLNQAYQELDALAAGPGIDVPTLILSNPQDVIVDPTAHTCDKFTASCEVIEYPGFGHEMFTAAERELPIGDVRTFLGY